MEDPLGAAQARQCIAMQGGGPRRGGEVYSRNCDGTLWHIKPPKLLNNPCDGILLLHIASSTNTLVEYQWREGRFGKQTSSAAAPLVSSLWLRWPQCTHLVSPLSPMEWRPKGFSGHYIQAFWVHVYNDWVSACVTAQAETRLPLFAGYLRAFDIVIPPQPSLISLSVSVTAQGGKGGGQIKK